MAGGPIFANSLYLGGANGNLFPNFYAGGGGNLSSHDEGIGVIASFNSSNGVTELRYIMPPLIPTGTMKLRTLTLANATTGAAAFAVLAANVSGGGSPSAVTLLSQGSSTISWGASSADKYQEVKTTFTTFTPAGNDVVVVALSMLSGPWTLAQVSTWIPSVIWE